MIPGILDLSWTVVLVMTGMLELPVFLVFGNTTTLPTSTSCYCFTLPISREEANNSALGWVERYLRHGNTSRPYALNTTGNKRPRCRYYHTILHYWRMSDFSFIFQQHESANLKIVGRMMSKSSLLVATLLSARCQGWRTWYFRYESRLPPPRLDLRLIVSEIGNHEFLKDKKPWPPLTLCFAEYKSRETDIRELFTGRENAPSKGNGPLTSLQRPDFRYN